jgi:hypothetical protein
MPMNDEIHPIFRFVIDNYEPIRLFLTSFPLMIPIIFVVLVIYSTGRVFLNEKKIIILKFDITMN